MLPPTFCCVLKALVKANGALALFSAAITPSVAMSKRLIPDMNFDPSGAMESTEDAPDTVRLRSTMPDATSYTNR